MLHFTIPLPPISKKNSQQIMINRTTGKPFIMPSKNYKQYEAAAMWYIPKVSTIDTCVNVKCLFYMPTRRRCDLTNMLEAIDDIMVKARLLDDDNFNVIHSHDGSRILYDKDNPRTEVFIESAAADQPAPNDQCERMLVDVLSMSIKEWEALKEKLEEAKNKKD